ncbi:acyloxyacyl hydrolase [Shimia sp. R11_0]|uniref:acyloxyacyl hydrolase n=1 Tax=Shimia sp. R11_0 TaxID=2821096 RepID=UPI001ADCC3B7|nr:acyloxyacyl hydrolase [Shimia sp. R11_0]MBO9477953.1 acyloxyacyl hydrolase [Shimia sp. R11_0]
MKNFCMVCATLLFTSQASAQEVVVGLGFSDFSDGSALDAATLQLEYTATPFKSTERWNHHFGGILTVDKESDVFVGFGVLSRYSLQNDWFLEGSFRPGLFFEGISLNDLGQTLEFRSALAVGRYVGESSAVSLELSHKSNGGLSSTNPGVNKLSLRYHHSF